MPAILKRDGKEEEFDSEKIHRSVLNVGVPEPMAREIVTRIEPAKARTTNEVRRNVAEELRKSDPALAQLYESTRNLAARRAVEAATGTVKMSTGTMSALGLTQGDQVVLQYRDRTHMLMAKMGVVDKKEMHINEADLKKLGAPEGTRLAIRRAE